mgnify:CR=1 FL=1
MPRIGPIELGDFPLLLAPMEDVSDPPFRALCKKHGADLMYTCLLYTSDAADERSSVALGGRGNIKKKNKQ